jgi:hypothetical protein
MTRTWDRSGLGLALGFAAVLAVLAWWVAVATGGGTTTAAQYQRQLGARFTAWDLNGDGSLDKEELAKAFRGRDAKPFDATPQDKNSQIYGLTLVSLPRHAMPVQLAVADRLQQNGGSGKTNKDYTQLADFQFLTLADTNNDQRVSQQEFDTWAKGYARALNARDRALKSLEQAQGRLAKAKTAKTRQTAQKAVERANASMNQAMDQINAVPVAIRQALNVGLR